MNQLADLELAEKDESKSCVFDFPDRPPDSNPPGPFPIDPPDCFPYCRIDDWPHPLPFPWPPPPPPPIHHGPGIASFCSGFTTAGAGGGGLSHYPSAILTIPGVGQIQIIDDNFSDLTVYLGGAATLGDHIAFINRHLTANVFLALEIGINVTKLLLAHPEINVFLMELILGAHSEFPTVIRPGEMASEIDITGGAVSQVVYNFPIDLDMLLPITGTFQWYVHRSLGIYSYAAVDGVPLTPTLIP